MNRYPQAIRRPSGEIAKLSPGNERTFAPVCRFQTMTRNSESVSRFTVTTNALSGEKASLPNVLDSGSPACRRSPFFSSRPSRHTSLPVFASQIRAEPSQDAVATDVLSGEYATDVIRLMWTVNKWTGFAAQAG